MPNFDNLCRPWPDRLLRRGALHSTLLPHFVSQPPRHDRPCRQLVDGLGIATFPHYCRDEYCTSGLCVQ